MQQPDHVQMSDRVHLGIGAIQVVNLPVITPWENLLPVDDPPLFFDLLGDLMNTVLTQTFQRLGHVISHWVITVVAIVRHPYFFAFFAGLSANSSSDSCCG